MPVNLLSKRFSSFKKKSACQLEERHRRDPFCYDRVLVDPGCAEFCEFEYHSSFSTPLKHGYDEWLFPFILL